MLSHWYLLNLYVVHVAIHCYAKSTACPSESVPSNLTVQSGMPGSSVTAWHAPVYLADDCCLTSASTRHSLWSDDILTSIVSRTYSSYGVRTFAVAGLDVVCGTLFWFSLAIQTSPMDCLDDSWRDTFLAKHERGALWPRCVAPYKNATCIDGS